MSPSNIRRAAPALLAALALAAAPVRAAAGDVLVFAASSLTTALDRVGAAWSAETGHVAVMSYAGSSAHARQIQQGAPADIFISASTDWMDALEVSGDLRADTRRDILGNRLVLIAHGGDVPPVTLDETLDLVGLLEGGQLSMALVEAVPAGIYGRQALRALGLWDIVAPHVAQSYNVRSALAFVALGEAPLGIVYATDAAVEDAVTVIATFPQDSHAPIILPAAITAQSTSPEALSFLEFLISPTARTIWADHGFDVPG
ncbi:molybdate ABC transporter substrate-binding protein [Roseicyclus mahoneyensis]|uniref:Molybdate transport system substrate-binding protein n=1 Tax=Roseicyclus mahoneyensis TaxID=164332 RepID=A0A316H4A9_9RHOB|nr:molybdate ABC transporter substrate-binding protein [Roseicyclus mahoneyensis]PWK62403.1 molybdate transport system substrate-binding protein [Roseicyclus mahoneyensis]